MAHLKRLEKRSKKKQQQEFIAAFEDCANITIACKKAKIPRRTVYNWLNEKVKGEGDIDLPSPFKISFDESVAIAVGVLEDEAKRRAVKGVPEPVFYQGKKVGIVNKYSDTLLIVLLKAHSPEKYKERVSAEHSGPGGQPIQTETTQTILYLPKNKREKPNAETDGN